jgi:hypothetical protein
MIRYPQELSRRNLLKSVACGFGSLALAGLEHANAHPSSSLLARPSYFPQRAKRVIFIFMAGGTQSCGYFRLQTGTFL